MGLEPRGPRGAWEHTQKPEQHQFIGLVTGNTLSRQQGTHSVPNLCHPKREWHRSRQPPVPSSPSGHTGPLSSARQGMRRLSLQLAQEAQQGLVKVLWLVQVAGMASVRHHSHAVPGEVPEALQGLGTQACVTVTVED